MKAKQTAHKTLERTKAIIVARGNMEKRRMKKTVRQINETIQEQCKLYENGLKLTPIEISVTPDDTWAPRATSRIAKILFDFAAPTKRTAKGCGLFTSHHQGGGSTLHNIATRVRQILSKIQGILLRSPYSFTEGHVRPLLFVKYWNEEYSEWLLSQGFHQSPSDPSYTS